MKQMNYKKLIIPNIPYVFFVYLFDKVGQAVRLAPGADISEKILNITQGFSEAFSNALPSVHPLDLLIGIVGAVVIRLIVYVKGKNAKDGYNLVAILPDSLTSPQLTAEWETRLTGIAKGSDSPADFMRGIEEMTAGLVKTYSAISED
ncbi:hypothetical protein, partial [Flavonifractor plautii]|nr:hypothetical protein [Flavonifractor plautii]